VECAEMIFIRNLFLHSKNGVIVVEKETYETRTVDYLSRNGISYVKRWICECGTSNSNKKFYCRECGEPRYTLDFLL